MTLAALIAPALMIISKDHSRKTIKAVITADAEPMAQAVVEITKTG